MRSRGPPRSRFAAISDGLWKKTRVSSKAVRTSSGGEAEKADAQADEDKRAWLGLHLTLPGAAASAVRCSAASASRRRAATRRLASSKPTSTTAVAPKAGQT